MWLLNVSAHLTCRQVLQRFELQGVLPFGAEGSSALTSRSLRFLGLQKATRVGSWKICCNLSETCRTGSFSLRRGSLGSNVGTLLFLFFLLAFQGSLSLDSCRLSLDWCHTHVSLGVGLAPEFAAGNIPLRNKCGVDEVLDCRGLLACNGGAVPGQILMYVSGLAVEVR